MPLPQNCFDGMNERVDTIPSEKVLEKIKMRI